MDKIVLKAKKRDMNISAASLRAEKMLPGICYGAGKENIAVQMDYQEFRRTYNKAGENTVIELDIDGKKHNVLIHDMQIDPIYGTASHVDFMLLDMKATIATKIPVVTIGEAPVIKEQGAMLNLVMSEIEVRCLPGDIPQEFTVDISALVESHSAIRVADLVVPEGVVVLEDEDATIVNTVMPTAETEEIAPAEAEEAAIAAGEKTEE